MLETSRYSGGDNGRGDSIARTVISALCYQNKVHEFSIPIWKSFKYFIHGDKWNPVRHPKDARTFDFSRDHTTWFVIWLRLFLPLQLSCSLNIPFKISDKFNQSIDQYLWIRAIAKHQWIYKFLYWAITSIWMRFTNRWNRLLRNLSGIKSVPYLDFKATPENELTPKELFARKYSVPSYSFDTLAFMIYCLDNGWFKNRLKKLMIPLVENSNYLIRKLMNDKFTDIELNEIKYYSGMDGFRWNRRLDKTTDIELFPLSGPQPEYNIDVDILKVNWY